MRECGSRLDPRLERFWRVVSNRQLIANRLNALKSTGPRSDSGKQQVRLNALRHGFTSLNRTEMQENILSELIHLLLAEHGCQDFAYHIASKIFEYERTEQYLFGLALREQKGKGGLIDHTALELTEQETINLSIEKSDLERTLINIPMSNPDRNTVQWKIKSLSFLIKESIKKQRRIIDNAANEAYRSRQHFKRSSNQLIKALKLVR